MSYLGKQCKDCNQVHVEVPHHCPKDADVSRLSARVKVLEEALKKSQADYDESYAVKEKAYLVAMDADATQKAAFVLLSRAKEEIERLKRSEAVARERLVCEQVDRTHLALALRVAEAARKIAPQGITAAQLRKAPGHLMSAGLADLLDALAALSPRAGEGGA